MKKEYEGTQGKPVAAFVVSLLAGLWMFVSSAAGGMGWRGWMDHGRMMGGMGRGGMQMWMWRHDYMNNFMTAAISYVTCVNARETRVAVRRPESGSLGTKKHEQKET